MELALFVRFTETRPPPSTLEQCQQPVGTRVAPRPAAVDRFLLRALRVEALEYLMDEYAETLWQRLLSRNGVNARVLVAKWADLVDLDVGGRQNNALAANRQERLERVFVALLQQPSPKKLFSL